MHEAQSVMNALGLNTRASVRAHAQLNPQDVSRLKNALENDSKGYIKHAALALAHGIHAANSAHSTWATIPLYYSVFYSARAWLCIQNTCIFYASSSPCSIDVNPGSSATTLKGQTHEAVLSEFSRKNRNSYFLSQDIDQMSPLDWLRNKRELANYKNAAPFEPKIFECFTASKRAGMRRALTQYLADSHGLYVFDKDHAIIAFPLCFFNNAQKALRTQTNSPFDDQFQKTLFALLQDRSGKLTPITNLLS